VAGGRPEGACRKPVLVAAVTPRARQAAGMTAAGRPAVLWGLVAGHAAAAGRRVSVADVCAVAVGCAQLSGAWVTAWGGRRPDFVMCVTGPAEPRR
jgi:hypothetical protein